MSPAPRRAAVDGVSVLLLTHPGGTVVDQVLDTLGDQQPVPDRIVVAGLSEDSEEGSRARTHPLTDQGVDIVLRPAPAGVGDNPLAAAVDDALDHLPDDPAHWVWVLHDDSVPRPGALAALLEPARRTSRVGVVGPKLVRDDDPRVLVGVGHHLTRTGRPVDDDSTGLVDQGQFDSRSDVIGVPLAGMLVRSDVLCEVGGLDPAFDEGAEGLDLSWRSHLRGHRVVVAPHAVVEQGDIGLGISSPLRHRRRLRQVALARGSLWRMPLRALAVALAALAATVGLLLLKRPQEARAELADLTAVLSPARGTAARWRFRGRRVVRERDLQGLFESTGEGWRGTGETVQEVLSPGRSRGAAGGASRAGVETGPVADDVVSLGDDQGRRRRWWSWWLLAAVLVCAGVALARWREILPGLSPDGDGVLGGEVTTSGAGAADLWGLWALPWSGSGLGTGDAAPLWVLPLSGLTWLAERLPGGPDATASGDVVTAWLLWAAVPAACVTAYLAGRVGTRSRPLRAVLGLAWAGLAPLAVGVDEGRLGPVLVHILAPLLVAGLLVSSDREAAPRVSATATAGTVLVAALAAWFVPVVLLWTSAVAALMLLLGPGRVRWRGLVLLLLPALLLGPWLVDLWREPLLALTGAGAATVQGAVPPWQTLLLHPGGSVPPVLWWTAPFWVLALLASLVAGRPGRRATVLMAGALPALAAALAAPWVQVATVPPGFSDAGQPLTLWPGTFLTIAGAAVLLAAVTGADAALAPVAGAGRSAGLLTAALSLVALVAAAASVGVLAWRAAGTPDADLVVAAPALPAVVAEQASGPTAVRLLDLTPQGPPDSYVVRYRLIGAEPDPWVRDRVREALLAPPAVDESTVRDLVDAQATGAAVDGPAALRGLADLAVGYVAVDAEVDHPLVSRLDAVPGLARISAPQGGALWRVVPADGDSGGPARARVVDDTGAVVGVLEVAGPHGVTDTTVPPSARGGTLVVSEGLGWADVAQVRADGVALDPLPGAGAVSSPSFALPDDAGSVVVELPVAHSTWWLLTAVLAAVVGFLALPVGGGRRREVS